MDVVERFPGATPFSLLQPFFPAFRPASEEQESERSPPVRPTLHKIPYRLTDDGTHKRSPKSPKCHPEQGEAYRVEQNEDCESDVEEADEKEEPGRQCGIGNTEKRKPFYPRLFSLERKNAMTEEFTENGNA